MDLVRISRQNGGSFGGIPLPELLYLAKRTISGPGLRVFYLLSWARTSLSVASTT